MKQVTFGSVENGTTLVYNGEEYIKLDKVKISCCRFTNAQSVSNSSNKIGIKDGEIVEVSE
jgi:hypothetical protein